MPIQHKILTSLLLGGLLLISGCANLPRREPVQAYVVGLEPLQGQGLELRMLVRLRVQNPNDAPIEFNGVHIAMDVQGKSFATGVSDASGVVPRFGESVITVPVSISAFRLMRGAMDVFGADASGKIRYELRGKLAGQGFSSMRFRSTGELALPEDVYAPQRGDDT